MTTQELMRVVSDRGGGGVNPAKMCISLLRPTTSGSDVDVVGSAKRRGAGSGECGRGSLEAVQIAGPEGVFEEWKVLVVPLQCCWCLLSLSKPTCWCPVFFFVLDFQ